MYNGSNYLASLRPHVGSVYFWWERYYPFIPILIIPYWSIDAFFVCAPFFIPTRYRLRQHVLRILSAILIAGFFFVTMPLTLAWPRPQVEGMLGGLFGSLNAFHNFYNCAPSLHIALRTLLWTVYVGPRRGLVRIVLGVWFLLIGLSTLLTWQHYIVDVLTGQLLGLFCLHCFPSQAVIDPEVHALRRINAWRPIAILYALVALVLILAAIGSWPLGAVLLWPAISVALVAIAYAGAGPGWLGKAGGTFPNGSRWLLVPYRWAALLTFRHFSRNLASALEVCPGVFIGKRWTPGWAGPDLVSVLDVSAEYPEHAAWRQLNYLNIPVLDLTCPSANQLAQSCRFIEESARPLLIHCSLGLGRSAVVAAAYLLVSGRAADVDEALAQVRSIQPRAALVPGVEQVLANLKLAPAAD